MNAKTTCLITGCDFLDVDGKRWIHGDLHQLLDVMIFNAWGCEWHEGPLEDDVMAVYATAFHENHKTLVFPLALTVFNEAAHHHLKHLLAEEVQNAPRIVLPGTNSVN